MKVLLQVEPSNIEEYDFVIDPSGKSGYPRDFKYGLSLIEDNEATLINFKCLNRVHLSEINIIKSYIDKLRYNGEFIIEGINLYEVNRNFMLGNLKMKEYNYLLYGEKLDIYRTCSSYTPDFIKTILIESGLKIETIRINKDYTFLIRAKREQKN